MLVIGGIAIGVKAIIAAAVFACIFITFLIKCYPQIKSLIQVIKSDFEDLYNTCKSKMLSYWQRRKKSDKPHKHHIVAKGHSDEYAQKSRDILENVNIRVLTDERNLVTLKARFHLPLHCKEYFKFVYNCLEPYEGSEPCVSNVLFSIKQMLISLNKGA